MHVHCPCYSCNNKAVSRMMELRHWQESELMYSRNREYGGAEVEGTGDNKISEEDRYFSTGRLINS